MQLSFHVPVSPMHRGEGSFAALLQNRRDEVFGDDYDHSGASGNGNREIDATSNWRTRPLPLAARISLVRRVFHGVLFQFWLTFCTLRHDCSRNARKLVHVMSTRSRRHVPLQDTSNIGIPSRGQSTPMEACIRRVWLEHPPLSAKASEELKRSLAEWQAWKQSRAEQVGPCQQSRASRCPFNNSAGDGHG